MLGNKGRLGRRQIGSRFGATVSPGVDFQPLTHRYVNRYPSPVKGVESPCG